MFNNTSGGSYSPRLSAGSVSKFNKTSRPAHSNGSYGGEKVYIERKNIFVRDAKLNPFREDRRPAREQAPAARSFDSRSGGGDRFGSRPSYSSSAPRSGGYQGRSRQGGSGRAPARGRGMRGDIINENMFINKATASEEVVYTPDHTFADFKMHKALLANIIAKGYINPSPIQDKSVPVGLLGKDVIGIANTGTGKTAAFLIPIIDALLNDKHKKAIVLAPTRELAQQIDAEFRSFADRLGLFSAVCVGGAPIFNQIRLLSRGVHIVIGTPGRVQDLIERGKIRTADYHIAVLDEADRMLDMGFVDDMRAILHTMPKERQSFFFSATFSREIKELCSEFLNNPETIEIKSRATSENIDQDVVRVSRGGTHKIEALHDILNDPEANKVLIFAETKRNVDNLSEDLISRGFKASALHGDMRNRARELVVKQLKEGRVQVVVATDVAARGIDIKDITHVINYEIPQNYETYIHRIGRTGRAGKAGKALTFVYGSGM
jgi:ATP-dependent RNA helicase RhlE